MCEEVGYRDTEGGRRLTLMLDFKVRLNERILRLLDQIHAIVGAFLHECPLSSIAPGIVLGVNGVLGELSAVVSHDKTTIVI